MVEHEYDDAIHKFKSAVSRHNDKSIAYWIRVINEIGIKDKDTDIKNLFRKHKERLIAKRSRY